jgi:hypothetical protein
MAIMLWAVAVLGSDDAQLRERYQEACKVLRYAKEADYRYESDAAWQGYVKAQRLLLAIQDRHPDWNKDIIIAQLNDCSEGIRRTASEAIQYVDTVKEGVVQIATQLDLIDQRKAYFVKHFEWEGKRLQEICSLLHLVGEKAGEESEVSPGDYFDPEEEGSRIAKIFEEWGTGEHGEATLAKDEIGDISEESTGDEEIEEELDEGEILGASPAEEDPDEDGLTTLQELELGTDPQQADTDGDGFFDGDEEETGYSPMDSNEYPQPPDVNSYEDGETDTPYGGV